MQDPHGGNIGNVCLTYGLQEEKVVDFSANINPLGFPSEIENAICSNIKTILHYPDPNCYELKKETCFKVRLQGFKYRCRQRVD